MMILYENNPRIARNARFVLEQIAQAKPGDNIVILADRDSYAEAHAFGAVAKQLGIHAFIADVDLYGGEDGYAHTPIMEPLRQAILHADIAFMTTPQMKTNFGVFLGSQKDCDSALTGKSKRFTFEIGGLGEWDLNEEELLRNRARTEALFALLQKTKELHITTRRGTDLHCDLSRGADGMYPVNGIIPFYSEVAIVPSLGTVNGVAVNDGASERAYGQRGFPIRPNIPGHREIYMEPLTLRFSDSLLTGYSGPAVQTQRLDQLLRTVSPRPDLCDEIGLVTTTSVENDAFGWCVDGSHHTRCVHVALGNNRNRKETIHSTEHIDFDLHDPSIVLDGKQVCRDGEFDDELLHV